MFKLAQKRKEQESDAAPAQKVGLRDRLLTKEFQEAVERAPKTCKIEASNPDCLHTFNVIVTPDEGFWKGGEFVFTVYVPEEYNYSPPKCMCKTKLWHPNIAETGEICLSILRDSSLGNGLCWLPTRSLKEVIWGINSLFTDLLNFDDPLNVQAAEMYATSRQQFETRVTRYIREYATPKPAPAVEKYISLPGRPDKPSRPWDRWF
ncbi:NEDD8-conjugating enzyme UBE2F-like [Sycon ciliatum]|uniref:NEDD8-conjugating enzyme UBE2F-like n=1 Tax=Sycon ciliatum TaxID=27933 RepID=UPI0020AE05BE|eukprot:scpid77783/ scgid14574/ NEDD8-conjugating enzyme UBE2F; NEDD8 carrier protein UBE2F; NEDD8 protein ligase UBE2F; NEDD8-conjugating enzyme 2; Ubiquitin-conjugating enzyme E2 F